MAGFLDGWPQGVLWVVALVADYGGLLAFGMVTQEPLSYQPPWKRIRGVRLAVRHDPYQQRWNSGDSAVLRAEEIGASGPYNAGRSVSPLSQVPERRERSSRLTRRTAQAYNTRKADCQEEVAMERDEAEFRAANERITTMAEELRKAELVRDRLEGLRRLMGSYPEGHDMRARLEALYVDRALEGVDEDIRLLMDALQHPRGT